MGALRPFFVLGTGGAVPIFLLEVNPMRQKARYLAHAAIIAALYAVLTHMQNILLPNSASMAIQLRLSESLCVLAYFTPAALPGLTIGCMVFNLTSGAALPPDWIVGSLATYLAVRSMRALRSHPFWGLFMPALFNAVLVGLELSIYIGGGFWLNALYVAIGETVVLVVFGWGLYCTIRKRRLDTRLFG